MTATKEAKSIIELFTAATASTSWGTIDDLYVAVSKDEALVAALLHGDVSQRVIKQEIRRLIKKVRGNDDHAVFASIKSQDADGNKVTHYKQEPLFDLSDYQQVVDYHNGRVIHHAQEAVYYKNQCSVRFNEQIPLAFSEANILLD